MGKVGLSSSVKNIPYFFRKNWSYVIGYSFLFIGLRIIGGNACFQADANCWQSWSIYAVEHGLANVYSLRYNDYPPLYHYVLYSFGKLMGGNPARIADHLHYLKIFTLLFDFGGALLVASLAPRGRERVFLSLLLLLNVAYLYNTLVWQQVDAIYSCLCFGAIIAALQGRSVLVGLLFVLALNMKLQSVIFFPPLILILLSHWRRAPKLLVRTIGVSILLQLIILIPFIWAGDYNYLPRIWSIVRGAGDRHPFISLNAFNFWHLLIWVQSLRSVSDTLCFAGFSYKHWGLLLFGMASAVVLWPLFWQALQLFIRQEVMSIVYYPLILLTCGLLPIVFSYFNTQMHERYWHASLLFLVSYGYLIKNYWLFILTSIAYFLNLESVSQQFHCQSFILYNAQFIAVVFTLVLILGIMQLYSETSKLRSSQPSVKAVYSQAV